MAQEHLVGLSQDLTWHYKESKDESSWEFDSAACLGLMGGMRISKWRINSLRHIDKEEEKHKVGYVGLCKIRKDAKEK